MSYAHTKRRKLIATLKRKHDKNWLYHSDQACARAQKKIHGRLTGTMQDLVDKGLLTV